VIRGGLLALLPLLVLSGCASAPQPPVQEPQIKDTGAEALAFDALRDASPETLKKAATLLSTPEVAASPRGVDLAGLGRELAELLYPELSDLGFPADAQTETYGKLFAAVKEKSIHPPAEGESGFFTLAIPALVLLDPSTEIDPSSLDVLEANLREADRISGKSSVLPPYLLALIAERRTSAAASAPDKTAIDFFYECVFRDPSFYIGEKIVARAAMDEGKPQEAAAAAARALLYTPDDIEILLLRAQALERTGDWYQALKFLDLILVRVPDSAQVLHLKAQILADNANRPDDALRLLDEAEQKFPDDPSFPELRGRIILAQGDTEAGATALNRALEIETDRPSALRILLNDAMRSKNWPQAASFFSRIAPSERTGDDYAAGYQVYWDLGAYAEAAACARSLVSMGYGEYPRVLLARALHAEGADSEALSLIEAGLAHPKSPAEKSRLLSLRGEIGQGTDIEEALTDLRMALLEDPDNADALLAIAALLEALKEYHSASGYLKHASELMPEKTGLKAKIVELEQREETEKAGASPSPNP
jgi:tetratricopeptide (TPR) repeat protein